MHINSDSTLVIVRDANEAVMEMTPEQKETFKRKEAIRIAKQKKGNSHGMYSTTETGITIQKN